VARAAFPYCEECCHHLKALCGREHACKADRADAESHLHKVTRGPSCHHAIMPSCHHHAAASTRPPPPRNRERLKAAVGTEVRAGVHQREHGDTGSEGPSSLPTSALQASTQAHPIITQHTTHLLVQCIRKVIAAVLRILPNPHAPPYIPHRRCLRGIKAAAAWMLLIVCRLCALHGLHLSTWEGGHGLLPRSQDQSSLQVSPAVCLAPALVRMQRTCNRSCGTVTSCNARSRECARATWMTATTVPRQSCDRDHSQFMTNAGARRERKIEIKW
jgi:hypothetical protein